MPGSVRERPPGSGIWQLRYPVGPHPTKPRQSIVVTRTVRGSRRSAEKELARLVVEHERRPSGNETVAGLLARWLEHITARGRAKSTIVRYQGLVDLWINPQLGSIRLVDLTARHIDALYGRMTAAGQASASVRQAHAVLRAALTQAEKWDLVHRNVARLASPPSLDQAEEHVPSDDEAARLLDAAEAAGPGPHTLVLLALVTGARRGELAALRWCDVDFDRGAVTIDEAMDIDGERKATKSRTRRDAALPDFAVAHLAAERYRQVGLAESQLLEVPGDEAPVICVWPGEQPHKDTLTDWFGVVRRAAGVDSRVHLHSLRHWHITALTAAGVDSTTVARRVGHRDDTMVRRVYSHPTAAADRSAASVIGVVLGREATPDLPGP